MSETKKAIENLNTAKLILCNQQMLTPEMCVRIGQTITSAIALLKEQEAIVRCKDCIHYRYYGLTEGTVSECTIDHCENPDKEWFCAAGKRR